MKYFLDVSDLSSTRTFAFAFDTRDEALREFHVAHRHGGVEAEVYVIDENLTRERLAYFSKVLK